MDLGDFAQPEAILARIETCRQEIAELNRLFRMVVAHSRADAARRHRHEQHATSSSEGASERRPRQCVAMVEAHCTGPSRCASRGRSWRTCQGTRPKPRTKKIRREYTSRPRSTMTVKRFEIYDARVREVFGKTPENKTRTDAEQRQSLEDASGAGIICASPACDAPLASTS